MSPALWQRVGSGRRAGAGLWEGWARSRPLTLLLSPCRQSVSGAVCPGLCDRHVCGRRTVVWGWAALPWDAAAAGPDHVGVGSGPALLRPGPLPQLAGGSGAPLGPRLALALPGLPTAWGWDHLPDRSRCGPRGFLIPGRARGVQGEGSRRGGFSNSFRAQRRPPVPSLALPLPSLDSSIQGLGPTALPLLAPRGEWMVW